MPDVERSLRKAAQRLHPVPYWVLEKDYALGYLLSGMAQVPALSEALVLKGGTALRKFYFADYRFSEDLDFSTLAKPADIDAAMHAAADATRAMLLEEGPFEVALERLTLRDPHPGGQDGFTARVRFPNHREAMCRLKVEITHDEEVLMPPVLRSLLHPYPDPPSADWRCYALDEVIAEKLRALLQSRARLQARGWGASRVCRDYYDLWYLLRHSAPISGSFADLLSRKCALRQVTYSDVDDLLVPELQAVAEAEWERQLLPFVPAAPSAAQVLFELKALLANVPLKP